MADTRAPLTAADLVQIEKLDQEATPGPWAWDNRGVWCMAPGGIGGPVLDQDGGKDGSGIGRVGDAYPRGLNRPTESMQFIAEARDLLPRAAKDLRSQEVYYLARFPSDLMPRAFRSLEGAMAAAATEVGMVPVAVRWQVLANEHVWVARVADVTISIQRMKVEA